MTYEEIERKENKRDEILRMSDEPTGSRQIKLQELAGEVGASTISRRGAFHASEPELIDNINDALRTAAMIDMCKTANRNFIIALIAAVAAALSALAAWIAVLTR
jgi:hypothetical protein